MMALLTIATISCDDNDEELFIDGPESQLAFTSTAASSYLLTFDTRANTAERFVWTTVDFATPIAVNYEIQASADPANFDNAVVLTSTNENSAAVTVERLNEVALTLGLTPFSQEAVAVRVVGTTADVTMEPMVSDVLNLSVTPYTTESPKLWIPGNYASASGYGADWDPADEQTPFLEAADFGSTEYEGFVFMNVASPMFKFTPEMDWDEAYGDAGTGLLSTSGGDLSVPGPGYYYITVNLDPNGDGDFSDAMWEASERVWGIIGAATLPSNPSEWNDELDMTYDETTKLWTVELDMQAGEFKFRAQDWGGTTELSLQDAATNTLILGGGDNMSVAAAGRYRAELDLSTPRQYTYQLISI